MHMKYISPQFGSIVCLSPELDSRLFQARQAKKVGTPSKTERQIYREAAEGIISMTALEKASKGGVILTAYEDQIVTLDGKRIAKTYLVDDRFGDHESQFDQGFQEAEGVGKSKRIDRDLARKYLKTFLEEQLQRSAFNQPASGMFYLA